MIRPDSAPTHTPPGMRKKAPNIREALGRMAVTPPRHPRPAAVARLMATNGGTPNRTGQRMLNEDMHLVGGRGRQATQEGSDQE